ncbi:MAG: hypothetical protein ABJN42_03720 [Roseibium sp.]|uniref:hypothetical protein n=1 Tax=Roseibium sp. TaxID=1936156 RepID=UPI003297BAC6
MSTPKTAAIFGYYVNLDERGEFYADVRNEEGNTVFEVRVDGENQDNIFTDGFMSHKGDVEGLETHLVDLDIISADDALMDSSEFETVIEQRKDDAHSFDF